MVKTIDITKALAIEGWMTQEELEWLATQALEHRSIVEVGCYLGRSTRAMLDNTSGSLYAYDDWKGPRDVELTPAQREGLYDQFCRNLYEYVECNRLRIIKADYTVSLNLGTEIVYSTPDMVFIDGSHLYQDVVRDILFWKHKVKGILCGHDADTAAVALAVTDVLGPVKRATNTSIWHKEL